MIKNYSKPSFEETNSTHIKPDKETISFLLAYSKSIKIQKSKTIENIRFDQN